MDIDQKKITNEHIVSNGNMLFLLRHLVRALWNGGRAILIVWIAKEGLSKEENVPKRSTLNTVKCKPICTISILQLVRSTDFGQTIQWL